MCARRSLSALLTILPLLAATLSADELDFRRDVRPILSDRCFACHGPDEHDRRGDLRLDREDDFARVSDEGLRILESGDRARSEIWRRVTSKDPKVRMPPPSAKLTLGADELETIGRWIDGGGKVEGHWSFVPLREVPLPTAASTEWSSHPIDRFVATELHERSLAPSPRASRERLIRRATFDLTGLPPTEGEIDAFIADDSPDAWERVVDRLLASPRYGERMAVEWLDLARYADSYGFQVDRERSVWRWRDAVIDAFNRNQPFDEFATWQIAGDLLPDPTDEQILATTFGRLHQQKTEGGTVEEEFRVEYVADRTQTFGTTFLGLTLECSRCHDHKFDPITTKEYYQLFAFFNNIDEAGLYAYFGSAIPTPTLFVASDDAKQRIAEVETRIAASESELDTLATRRHEVFDDWLAASRIVSDGSASSRSASNGRAAAEIPGLIAHLPFDDAEGGQLANLARPDDRSALQGENRLGPGKFGRGVLLSGDDPVGLRVGNFTRNQPFSVALWLRTPDVKERAVVFHRSRAWTDSGSRGYQLLIEDGRPSAALVHFWPGNALGVRAKEPLEPGRWTHIVVTWDGSSRAAGLRIWIDGELAPVDVVRDGLTKNITGTGGDQIAIGERFRDRGFQGGTVDDFRVYERELSAIEVAEVAGRGELTAALSAPRESLTAEARERLLRYWLSAHDEEYRRGLAELEAARSERSRAVDGIEEIMVMRERAVRRETHVLFRGHYASPREAVEPDTPAAFPPLPDDRPPDRLALARWLFHPDHPLTARVAVNRLWKIAFGRGLVGTPNDFGNQGDQPTYRELLDWLALEFRRQGWDQKAMLRQILLSETYRQDSEAPAERIANDPENRWLARGPSARLPAEMIRDNALAASGLLVDVRGGPPAKPYDVAVSFKPMAHDHGANLYRRSVYTFWKRTGPAPSMMVFDAVKRDVCSAKRETTSSPLQALVLLNDPQFVEASRALAANVLARSGGEPIRCIESTFRRLTGRRPQPREIDILLRLHDDALADFTARPEAANEYLSVGEWRAPEPHSKARLAAASVLANALLSFDDCVTKR